jgi:hypothetical protein
VRVEVEQLASGDRLAGEPYREPRLLVAGSAEELSGAAGTEVPDLGDGAYLAALWGEKPTGGYSVGFEGASVEGRGATVTLALGEPPPGLIVTQALTYPHAIGFARGLDPEGLEFSVRDLGGRTLEWPVLRVGS